MIHDPDTQFLQTAQQSRGDIGCMIRDGKDTPSPFNFDRAAVLFKEILYHLMVKAVDSAVQKLVVSGDISEKILCGAVIGQVAASLSGDIDFLSGLFIFFKNSHFAALLSCRFRGHQTGGAGPDHDHIFLH